MAELIERSTVIDVLKETGIIVDNDLGHLVVEEIERIEATTEAEIRAKAIDEFAEAMKCFIASQVDCVDGILPVDYCCEVFQSEVDEIAEQLKGG